jgi:hypothetical protein
MYEQEQKYKIGERVNVQGWVGDDNGIVLDIDWVYHSRRGEHCWGYKIDFDGKEQLFTFRYIPEGYLRKLEEEGVV